MPTVRVCPHCKEPLQPSEVYLGWCGACGNSLSRPPERPTPLLEEQPRVPAEAAPAPPDWRWVARGVLLKMVALLMGVGGVVAVASAADWDASRAFNDPLPSGVGVLLAAAVVDVVGRLLCLATPQAATRWLIVMSVACQLSAVPQALGVALTPPGTDGRWSLLAGAVLAQIAAAVTFTVYLFAVGVYFRSRPVMALAVGIKVAMAGVAGVATIAAIVAALVVLLFVVGVLLLFVCPWLGCVVMSSAVRLGEEAMGPIGVALGSILALVELVYGLALAAVSWQLWRRKMLVR